MKPILVALALAVAVLGCVDDHPPIDDPDLATGEQASILCTQFVQNNVCPKLNGCSGGTYLPNECRTDVATWLDCARVTQVRFSDIETCRATIGAGATCDGLSAVSLPGVCMTMWRRP